MLNWLYIHLGIPGSGPWYGFWSGFGSDLGELTIVIAVLKFANCHEKGCWRIGLHYKGHVVCHKHKSRIKDEQAAKLDEIHRHVSALAPKAGNFPPPETS